MDLFSILDEWLIPIALIELFVFGNIAILIVILHAGGVI
jgi:hypothetical protein